MARPIKETPILTGKNAARFEKDIKNNVNNKVPISQYERAVRVYQSVKIAG